MKMQELGKSQDPIKDEDAAHPIASAWRPTLREIVRAFAERDFVLVRGIPSVAPVPANRADQVQRYIAAYGETLSELPEESWETSVCQWMVTHWDVLVDLWTVESGRSDLVLLARVFEVENGFHFEIASVYVP